MRARLTASSRLCTPSRWYRRSARSLAADREMPSLSAMTENGTGYSPTLPSIRSRKRSAWPIWRAYSSIM